LNSDASSREEVRAASCCSIYSFKSLLVSSYLAYFELTDAISFNCSFNYP
jgi:hypothetical protein